MLSTLIILIAFIFTLLASIKLLKTKTPGSKFIFFAFIGSIVISFLPLLVSLIDINEDNPLLEMTSSFLESVLLFVAAYGFWRFMNYFTGKSANKAIKTDG